MHSEIEERFRKQATRLPEIREQFAKRVVQWFFSEAEILASDNDEAFLHCHPSHLENMPDVFSEKQGNALYACGFDANDRLIVLQDFDSKTVFRKPGSKEPEMREVSTGELLIEEFFAYQSEFVIDASRFVRGELQYFRRLVFEGNLLVEEESFRNERYNHTKFEYEGEEQVRQLSISEKGHVFHEIVLNQNGEDAYFRVRKDGTRFQLYQPWPKGITVKSVKQTIRDRLLALVPHVVAEAKIPEPIYCVVLAYDGEGDILPPLIGIGVESEREKWQSEHGKRAKEWVWNPAEFHHFEKSHTQLEDEALEEACDLLNSRLAEGGSSAPAIKLLVEVATELNRQFWPEEICRTADFIVYAVDFELGSLRKNLKASVPFDRLELLRSKGFV